MLKKLKGKMKRRNTEPTMSAGNTSTTTSHHQMTLATPSEPDELDQNNTDF
jgi:hypothetical protein